MIQLSAYDVGPDGQRRQLAGPATYAPADLPLHTTVEMPCYCPLHGDGQGLALERDRGITPGRPAVVDRTTDDLGGQRHRGAAGCGPDDGACDRPASNEGNC